MRIPPHARARAADGVCAGFVFQIRASVLALENDLPEALSPSPTGSTRALGSFVLEDAVDEDGKTEEAASARVHPASTQPTEGGRPPHNVVDRTM